MEFELINLVSWFNLYRKQQKHKFGSLDEESRFEYLEKELGYKSNDGGYTYYKDEIPEIEISKLARLKKVVVYDDLTGQIIPESEINELDELRNCSLYPHTIIDESSIEESKRHIIIVEKSKKKRKGGRKLRIPVPESIKDYIKKINNNKCSVCGIYSKSNQIHHIDGDPANNELNNLTLLCYDCHIKTRTKEIYDRE